MNCNIDDSALPQKLVDMILGYQITQAIYVIATLGIADLLSAGPKSSDELAHLTEVNAPALYRMLRFLAAADVLVESKNRTFALTPLGNYLRSDIPNSAHGFAVCQGGGMMWSLFGNWLYSVQTGQSAIPKALGVDPGQFFRQDEHMDKEMAAQAMQLVSAAVSVYDFSDMRTLVDVGGKHGHMLVTILKAHPQLSGVLFDQPPVIEKARQFMESTEVMDRCELVTGDFFVSVPSGYDGYLLARVIQNWSDEQAIAILKNCHRAMHKDGKLLILEDIIPAEQQPDLRTLRSDIAMLLMSSGGQGRTEAEHRALLEAAGFELVQTVPFQPPYSLIEARPGL